MERACDPAPSPQHPGLPPGAPPLTPPYPNQQRRSHALSDQMIKDQMDKKFGSPWHVIVGRAFAYEITYEVRARRGNLPATCALPHATLARGAVAPGG